MCTSSAHFGWNMGFTRMKRLFILASGWMGCWVMAGAGQAEQGGLTPAEPPGSFWRGLVSSSEAQPVRVSAVLVGPPEGREAELRITALMEPDWYIYSLTQVPGPATPSRIELAPSDTYRLEGPFRPEPPPQRKQDPTLGDVWIETHAGQVTWRGLVRLAEGVAPQQLAIAGRLRAQPCTSTRCLAPQEFPFVAQWAPGPIDPNLLGGGTASASSGGSTPAFAPKEEPTSEQSHSPGPMSAVSLPSQSLSPSNLAVKVGLAFLGGLILNLMPCVLPVLSLKLFSFLQQAGQSRSHIMALNLWYTAGLMSVFLVLAVLTAGLGYAWGEQFTLAWFKIALTALVFVMALSFLGVWEIPIPGFTGGKRSVELQQKEGPAGAFFKGVFATILATPCSGPFLGALFGFLLAQPPLVVFVIFGAVGLGMAFPYLVLGAFPEWVRFLPKPGEWMAILKELMGFFLLGTVVFLFTTLPSRYFVPTLALLVGLWLACWWIGRVPLTASRLAKIAAWVGGPSVAALIGWSAFTLLAHEATLFSPPATASARPGSSAPGALAKIPWEPFSPERLRQARAEGKTVFVYFTADWCLTCKFNLRWAIETAEVRQWIAEHGVRPLLADWTDESPVIKKALNELGYNSIPVAVIWPADPKRNPIVLPDLIRKTQLLQAFKSAESKETPPPN